MLLRRLTRLKQNLFVHASTPCLRKQKFQDQLFLFSSAPLLDDVQCVEEGVDGRVDRQGKDGHGHVDLTWDSDTSGGQQTQEANREPAQEVGHGDGDQAPSDGDVLGASCRVNSAHWTSADRQENDDLSHSD